MSAGRRTIGAAPTALPLATVALLVGCSANTRDYAEQAERFLTSDDAMTARFATEFTAPDCATPDSTEVGATFACTATADDGSEWAFVVTIEPDGHYRVARR